MAEHVDSLIPTPSGELLILEEGTHASAISSGFRILGGTAFRPVLRSRTNSRPSPGGPASSWRFFRTVFLAILGLRAQRPAGGSRRAWPAAVNHILYRSRRRSESLSLGKTWTMPRPPSRVVNRNVASSSYLKSVHVSSKRASELVASRPSCKRLVFLNLRLEGVPSTVVDQPELADRRPRRNPGNERRCHSADTMR